LTTVDFDHKYLPNGSTDISKIGKVLDQLHFIPYRMKKKLVNFGPLTTKL